MEASPFSAALGQQQFLNLFVTQLQHQDPLEPTGQEDFLQQLAQFSTVEGIERLNEGFDTQTKLRELTDGVSLLGKEVRTNGNSDSIGVVDEVRQSDGQVLVSIGGTLVPLADITSVVQAQ